MKTLHFWIPLVIILCAGSCAGVNVYHLTKRPPVPPPAPPEWSIGIYVHPDGRVEMARFFGPGPLPTVTINGVVAESRHYSTVQLDTDSVVVITGQP